MKRVRDFFGYLLGGVLFVALIPTIMWLASGMPTLWPVDTWRCIVAPIVMLVGLVLSIWTIVYMRSRGKGNPMDAFGHEVAPRTQHLMIEGPYKINRNPMLTGTLVYLMGAAVWRRVAVDLAIVRRVCRLLCHHDGAGAKRRKTPPPRLR